MSKACPCGAGKSYEACCGPLHARTLSAITAEQLMRSRYCAFAVGDADYLLSTWDASTRPTDLTLPTDITWTRLRVLDIVAGGPDDPEGVVEFRAHFRREGAPETLQERSHFTRNRANLWRYHSAGD